VSACPSPAIRALESIAFEFVAAISLSACDFDGVTPEKAAPAVKDDNVLVKPTIQRRFDVRAAADPRKKGHPIQAGTKMPLARARKTRRAVRRRFTSRDDRS